MLTLPEAKRFLQEAASDAINQEQITEAIDGITLAFDDHFGPIITRAITAEEHPGGGTRLRVRRRPVYAWGTVTEYEGLRATELTRETPGTEPVDGYRAKRDNKGRWDGTITRTTSGAKSRFGRSWVIIDYTAGRFPTVADVDQQFKQAAGIAIVAWFRYRQANLGETGEYVVPRANFPTFVIPKAARDLLADEVYGDVDTGIA